MPALNTQSARDMIGKTFGFQLLERDSPPFTGCSRQHRKQQPLMRNAPARKLTRFSNHIQV